MQIATEGGVVSYRLSGSGSRLILCAPSIGDLRQEYRLIVPDLVKAGFRVATMDIRGMGDSSANFENYTAESIARDMLSLLDGIDHRGPAWIIGCSLTAASAVWAAVESPEKVEGLVLISPALRDEPIPLSKRLLYDFVLRQPWGPGLWARFYRSLYRKGYPADFKEYLSRLRYNLSERGRMRALRKMTFSDRSACASRLEKVSQRILAIYGSEDPDFISSGEEAEWVREKSGANVFIIDGVGHYPHVESPDEVIEKLLKFLA